MYIVFAFYHFLTPPESIEDPQKLIKDHKKFFEGKDVKGRIYINEEGINGQMSIHEKDAESYVGWLHTFPFFKDVEFKVHLHPEHAFAKLTVKYRKQLVALDTKVDLRLAGEHLCSEKWSEMIKEKNDNTILIDVRNNYEWKVGHFEGALLPDLENFRDFGEYIEHLKKIYDAKNTKVMMYCTGGIRCELYSALMKEKGFDTIYQLQGGVIKYGIEEGIKHWKGKLFVFDDRMVVPISKDQVEPISYCYKCDKKADTYHNCANMDCNALFISCEDCVDKLSGCCCETCMDAPRVRAFNRSANPKPFRKLPYDQKLMFSKTSLTS